MFAFLIFYIIVAGLGQLTLSYKTETRFLERWAVGLALIPVLGVLLNLLHIPLDWRIFLGLGLLGSAGTFFRKRTQGQPLIPAIHLPKPTWQTAVIMCVMVFAVVIYCWGPFQYPWLEDDDPWSHAAGIKYIALEHNLNAPDGLFQYLNPYPPGYDLILGLMHQISPSLYVTLKFFNGVFVVLGFAFFYLMSRELMVRRSTSALALFFLALVPCYLTHFIWAHSLVITLFFPAFYFLLKSLKDRSYILPAAICWGAVTLIQPTQPIKFAIMALLMIMAYSRTGIRWRNLILIAALAGAISLLWWGPVLFKSLSGSSHVALRAGAKIVGATSETTSVIENIFSPTLGTATQAYSWMHFLFIANPNLINNPTGLTPIYVFLASLGMLISLKRISQRGRTDQTKACHLTLLLWTIFTFLGINSMTFHLPVGLFAFRFWMLFAIPISLLCAEGLYTFSHQMSHPWKQALIIGLFLVATIRTSLPFKWWFNTSEWSYGVHWVDDEDINGYVWLRQTLPVNTKVFAFTDNILVLGHDMRSDFWTPEYQQQLGEGFRLEPNVLHRRLAAQGYDAVIITPRDLGKFGRDAVNEKLRALFQHPGFRLIFQNEAVKIFQVLHPTTSSHQK